jgi:hypothetical protein
MVNIELTATGLGETAGLVAGFFWQIVWMRETQMIRKNIELTATGLGAAAGLAAGFFW